MAASVVLYFGALTASINNSTVTSTEVAWVPSIEWESAPNDMVCITGKAMGLEPDLMSVYGGGGSDCTATNGCGTHIHSGMGCADSAEQGGHWYDSSVVSEDPWKQVGYKMTDADGTANYADCVFVGFDVKNDPSLLEGRAFVVHKNDGSRASCGTFTRIYRPDQPEFPTSPPDGGGDKSTKKSKVDKKLKKTTKSDKATKKSKSAAPPADPAPPVEPTPP